MPSAVSATRPRQSVLTHRMRLHALNFLRATPLAQVLRQQPNQERELAKRNYKYEKRQNEIAKKKKKEEKEQRKQARKQESDDTGEATSTVGTEESDT